MTLSTSRWTSFRGELQYKETYRTTADGWLIHNQLLKNLNDDFLITTVSPAVPKEAKSMRKRLETILIWKISSQTPFQHWTRPCLEQPKNFACPRILLAKDHHSFRCEKHRLYITILQATLTMPLPWRQTPNHAGRLHQHTETYSLRRITDLQNVLVSNLPTLIGVRSLKERLTWMLRPPSQLSPTLQVVMSTTFPATPLAFQPYVALQDQLREGDLRQQYVPLWIKLQQRYKVRQLSVIIITRKRNHHLSIHLKVHPRHQMGSTRSG